MTGDLREVGEMLKMETELATRKSSGATRHLLFQRRFTIEQTLFDNRFSDCNSLKKIKKFVSKKRVASRQR